MSTKKLYVSEPKVGAPTSNPDSLALCYSLYEWDEGMIALLHVPGSDEGQIEFLWGENPVQIKARIVADLLALFPTIVEADIIFLGGWSSGF